MRRKLKLKAQGRFRSTGKAAQAPGALAFPGEAGNPKTPTSEGFLLLSSFARPSGSADSKQPFDSVVCSGQSVQGDYIPREK